MSGASGDRPCCKDGVRGSPAGVTVVSLHSSIFARCEEADGAPYGDCMSLVSQSVSGQKFARGVIALTPAWIRKRMTSSARRISLARPRQHARAARHTPPACPAARARDARNPRRRRRPVSRRPPPAPTVDLHRARARRGMASRRGDQREPARRRSRAAAGLDATGARKQGARTGAKARCPPAGAARNRQQ